MRLPINPSKVAPFLALAAITVCVSSAFSWATHLPLDTGRATVMLALAALVAVYGVGLFTLKRGHLKLGVVEIVVLALLARFILAFTSFPHLSDDIWRYIWDGHVQISGINPYMFPPSSSDLASIRTDIWPLINHPEVPTIYPPVAQLVFASVVALGGGLIGMRLVMIATELVTLIAVWRLAGRGEALSDARKGWLAAVLLWNPLMLVEFSSSGHLDVLAVAPLVWALALLVPKQLKRDGHHITESPLKWRGWLLAGGLLGLSTGAKLLGVIALVPLALWAVWPRGLWTRVAQTLTPRWDKRRAAARLAALGVGFGFVVMITSVPYVTPVVFGASGSFTKGLSTYARKWRANDGLFGLALEAQNRTLATVPLQNGNPPYWRFDHLAGLFERVGQTHIHEGRMVASTTFGSVELAAAVVKGLVALALFLALLFLLHLRVEPDRTTLVLLALLLLLAPTVHPWYVAWLVPLAAAHSRHARSLLGWSVLVLLIYAESVVGGSVGLRVVEYGIVVPWVAWEGWRGLTSPG